MRPFRSEQVLLLTPPSPEMRLYNGLPDDAKQQIDQAYGQFLLAAALQDLLMTWDFEGHRVFWEMAE